MTADEYMRSMIAGAGAGAQPAMGGGMLEAMGGPSAMAGVGAPAGAGSPSMAALGAGAMQNISKMGVQQQAPIMPGTPGVAPRGQQVKLDNTQMNPGAIDPRIQMGLAQLLFGGK